MERPGTTVTSFLYGTDYALLHAFFVAALREHVRQTGKFVKFGEAFRERRLAVGFYPLPHIRYSKPVAKVLP